MRQLVVIALATLLLLAVALYTEAHGPGQETPLPVAAEQAANRLIGARLEFTHAVAAACLVRERAVRERRFDIVNDLDEALQDDQCRDIASSN